MLQFIHASQSSAPTKITYSAPIVCIGITAAFTPELKVCCRSTREYTHTHMQGKVLFMHTHTSEDAVDASEGQLGLSAAHCHHDNIVTWRLCHSGTKWSNIHTVSNVKVLTFCEIAEVIFYTRTWKFTNLRILVPHGLSSVVRPLVESSRNTKCRQVCEHHCSRRNRFFWVKHVAKKQIYQV